MPRSLRYLPPGHMVEVTVGTIQGRLLLRPSRATTATIAGVVGHKRVAPRRGHLEGEERGTWAPVRSGAPRTRVAPQRRWARPPIPRRRSLQLQPSEHVIYNRRSTIVLDALARLSPVYYHTAVKTLTVRLPDRLFGDIEAESRRRNLPKSEVVRERLESGRSSGQGALAPAIADLVGSIDGLPSDLSAKKKQYLRATGYGGERRR